MCSASAGVTPTGFGFVHAPLFRRWRKSTLTHRAASGERLAHVDRVDDLAIREPRQGHGTFRRRDVLLQFVQEPLPLRRFHRGGPNAEAA